MVRAELPMPPIAKIRRYKTGPPIFTKANSTDINFELSLPTSRFRRNVGVWSGLHTDPQGNPMTTAEFEVKKDQWLPTPEDIGFVKSLVQRVTEPGKIAAWIAPPDRGINSNPVEYEYVKRC